jgi:S1-C subfamily serine protease
VNANIQAGDSGGALADSTGHVIGVDTAASGGHRLSRGGQAVTAQGFAIPINQALTIAHQIDSGTASSTVHIGGSAILGVSVNDSTSGVTVGDVLANGPAAQAAIAAGDVIVAVDGQNVDSTTTLTNILDQHHPGDNVKVTWVNQAQQQQTATVQLATGPVG